MFYLPFWIFILISAVLAISAFCLHKPGFIDVQIIIMVIAVSMSLDMLFCKHLCLYHYVDIKYRGWYSFWANSIAAPSLAVIFIKFIPKGKIKIALYIFIWSICCTLLELFILKPLGIIEYLLWKPFPHSTIGYIVALTWEYAYFRILQKHVK